MIWDFGNDRDTKRTLGIRDKQILYRNAKGRCQNPACDKKIDFDEMQVGHKMTIPRFIGQLQLEFPRYFQRIPWVLGHRVKYAVCPHYNPFASFQ
jgi:hypothetical protein